MFNKDHLNSPNSANVPASSSQPIINVDDEKTGPQHFLFRLKFTVKQGIFQLARLALPPPSSSPRVIFIILTHPFCLHCIAPKVECDVQNFEQQSSDQSNALLVLACPSRS